jgi:hypothetical protein
MELVRNTITKYVVGYCAHRVLKSQWTDHNAVHLTAVNIYVTGFVLLVY